MNDHDDIFEQELRSLRPTPPSPHVMRQIEQRLAPHPRRWPAIVLSALAAAALIALAATLVLTGPADSPSQPRPPQIVQHDQPRESLAHLSAWRYHQVARQSPGELMRLLDQQAADAPAIGGPTPTVHQLLESNS